MLGLFRVSVINSQNYGMDYSIPRCKLDHCYACVYTRGLLSSTTASQHNMFDSAKLTNDYCALDEVPNSRHCPRLVRGSRYTGADHIILKGGVPNVFSGTDHGLG